MPVQTNTIDIDVAFWPRMIAARKPFLALDYDGTLAPFQIDRDEAHPLPGMIDLLKAISKTGRTFLAIISGRAVLELASFVGGSEAILVGSHGFEIMRPGRGVSLINPTGVQMKGLKAAARCVGPGIEPMLEIKPASIAFHTRGVEKTEAANLEALVHSIWSGIAAQHDLQCRRFNGGVELRSAGRDKGDAVLSLLAEAGADFSAYIGDDDTDEDAFRALRGRGVGIKVGTPDGETAAQGFLPDCQAVKVFLQTWHDLDAVKEGGSNE